MHYCWENKLNQTEIDHEVRIRMLEQAITRIDASFDKIESKIDNHFLWMIGFIFVSIVTPVILHSVKLV